MKQCNTSAKVIAIGSDFAIQSTSAEIGGLIVDKSAENRPKKIRFCANQFLLHC
jgi:hypothetical protein